MKTDRDRNTGSKECAHARTAVQATTLSGGQKSMASENKPYRTIKFYFKINQSLACRSERELIESVLILPVRSQGDGKGA